MENKECNNHESTVQVEIDLYELFWSVMARWRRILICGVISAFLIAVFSGIFGYLDLHGEEDRQLAQEQYDLMNQTYLLSKLTLSSSIRTITQGIDQLQTYETNSALFAIDPYNAHVRELTFFVDTGYEIIPGNSYQNTDYTSAVVFAYRSAIGKLNVESILAEKSGAAPTVENISGISFISFPEEQAVNNQAIQNNGADHTPVGILRIQVFGADTEQTDEIQRIIEAAIEDEKPAIKQNVHEHSIVLVSASEFNTVSNDLIQLHKTLDEKLDDLNTRLKDTISQYNSLTEPQQQNATLRTIFRTAMKYGVIGFVLGIILALLYYSLYYVLKAVLGGVDHIYHRYGIPVLGVYVKDNKATKIDRWIARHRDLNINHSEEFSTRMVAANLAQIYNGSACVLLAGTVDQDLISDLAKKVYTQFDAAKLIPSGNICSDPDSIQALSRCTAVILAEQIGKTTYAELDREIAKIRGLGKDLLGIILIGNARA